MTKETFLECINNIDEDLIEAVPERKKHSPVFKYGMLAACIVMVIILGVGIWQVTNVDESQNPETKMVENEPMMYVSNGTNFVYNNNVYRVVREEADLASNSLPNNVEMTEVGNVLSNNVLDIAGNNIGDIYEYRNNSDMSVLVLRQWDGTLMLAIDEDIYE